MLVCESAQKPHDSMFAAAISQFEACCRMSFMRPMDLACLIIRNSELTVCIRPSLHEEHYSPIAERVRLSSNYLRIQAGRLLAIAGGNLWLDWPCTAAGRSSLCHMPKPNPGDKEYMMTI